MTVTGRLGPTSLSWGVVDPLPLEAPLTPSETMQHRAAGEMLFLEGETPAGVYVLHSGEVDLLFAARNGSVKALRLATPGQILGLSSLVMEQQHDCSAIARLPCEVGFIARDTFLRMLDERPSVWCSVLRLLSSDLNAAYDDIRALAVR